MVGAILSLVSDQAGGVLREDIEQVIDQPPDVEAADQVAQIIASAPNDFFASRGISSCSAIISASGVRVICNISALVIGEIAAEERVKLGLLIIDTKRDRTYQGRFKPLEGFHARFYCDLPREWRFGLGDIKIMVSIVHEFSFWAFLADTGAHSVFELDQFERNGVVALKEMSTDRAAALCDAFEDVTLVKNNAVSAKASYAPVLFDVSDLLAYFLDSRLPTGIQRVQVEIISALVHVPMGRVIEIVAFDKDRDAWICVPKMFFNHLAVFSLKSGDTEEQVWVDAIGEIKARMKSGDAYKFVGCEQLVNLGTSWWIKNYFLAVRQAIQKHDISYVPFVHDFIPIVMPEHCMSNLSSEFIDWASSVLAHADRFLVNSEATKADLVRLAHDSGGADTIHVEVTTLDADISTTLGKRSRDSDLAVIFPKHVRTSPDFILFVSTVESRKNHGLLLDVWMMMERRGVANIPDLVFVGKRGWLNDHIYSKVEASSFLRKKVHFLSGVSDEALSRLYEECLFTVYPSFYEGWGLPVTEALCFGKVSVVSNVSSLPEAAGGFGATFDPYSTTDAYEKIVGLLSDRAALNMMEEDIAKHFVPRTWPEIASQIIRSLDAWYSEPRLKVDNKEVVFGQRVSMGSGKLDYPVAFHDNERYRTGRGWWWPENWGTWTKPCGAEISFSLPADAVGTSVQVAFWLRGVQGETCTVTIAGQGAPLILNMVDEEEKTALIEFEANSTDATFLIKANASADFGARTGGADTRITGCGVCGFAVNRSSDLASRLRLMEDIGFDNVSRIRSLRLT